MVGKGFGYVKFESKDCMQQAIDKLNGQKFKGRDLRIKKAVEARRLEKKQRRKNEKAFA
eukprot:CAMPEP_0202960966 /NCGR_PEP_ID=MMETSP1396-20130829/5083_1 /ASSEMBLY_ACC=CAM_ASM_000872 /TAXON_ID= /ORGANISM="Pseudokeronopsis sp., Strain Brazil" /LENGTH=58 /DNA_ID=CAMNT_0049680501 /DNA_START=435 /DNA_END=611 /DNA_ORIENTATION=+